jgi:hypothetical protein
MKIAIIGSPTRKDNDMPLILEAEKMFDSCAYVPITKVRFDMNRGLYVKYDHADLTNFDCVLPIPTFPHRELFYIVIKMLANHVCIPFDAEKYLVTSDSVLLSNYLNSKGIDTRSFFVVSSKSSVPYILKKMSFPLIVRPPNKKVVVHKPDTLKDILSLTKIGTPIRIETPAKAQRIVWSFVLGDDVIGCYEKGRIFYDIDRKLRSVSRKVRELVGCEFCALCFFFSNDKWIFNKLTFSPNFAKFQDIKGNLAAAILSHIKERTTKAAEKPWWHRIFEELRR